MKVNEQYFTVNYRLAACQDLSLDEKLLLAQIGGHDLRVHNESYENPLFRRDVIARQGWSLDKAKRNIKSLQKKGFIHRIPSDLGGVDRLSLTATGYSLYTTPKGDPFIKVRHNIASASVFDQRVSSGVKFLLSMIYSYEINNDTFYMAAKTIAEKFDVCTRTVERIIGRSGGWIEINQGSSVKKLTEKAKYLIEYGEDELRRTDFDLQQTNQYEGRESQFKKKSNTHVESSQSTTIANSVGVIPLQESTNGEQLIECLDLFEWFGDEEETRKVWSSLTPEQRDEVIRKIPSYVAATPVAPIERIPFELWINPKGETNTFRQWDGERRQAA